MTHEEIHESIAEKIESEWAAYRRIVLQLPDASIFASAREIHAAHICYKELAYNPDAYPDYLLEHLLTLPDLLETVREQWLDAERSTLSESVQSALRELWKQGPEYKAGLQADHTPGVVNNWQAFLPEVEHCRREMHQAVDDSFNNMLLAFAGVEREQETEQNGSRLLPLTASPAAFKGTKPEVVILPDQSRVPVRTWKNVVSAILTDCCADPQCLEKLMHLRGRVAGNFRSLISSKPDDMSVPLKICEELYVESKFDTEALLQNITGKLLNRVGYDYHRIVIQCRDPRLTASAQEVEIIPDEPEQHHGPEMAM